jgi:hypothetical protein
MGDIQIVYINIVVVYEIVYGLICKAIYMIFYLKYFLIHESTFGYFNP